MLAFGNCSEPVEVVVGVPRLLVVVVTLDLLLVDPCRLLVGVYSTGLLGEVVSIGILVGVDPIGPSLGVEPAGLSVGAGFFGLPPLGCPKFLMLVDCPMLGIVTDVETVDIPGSKSDGPGELTWRPSNS